MFNNIQNNNSSLRHVLPTFKDGNGNHRSRGHNFAFPPCQQSVLNNGHLDSDSTPRQKNEVYSFVWRDIPNCSKPKKWSWSECIISHSLSTLPDAEDCLYPRSRCKHSVCLSGNNAYVFGGKDGNIALNDTWLFDLDTGEWHVIRWKGYRLPSLQDHTMVSHENSLYVFGGSFSDAFDSDLPLWKLDTVAGTCTKLSAAKTSCQSPSGLNYPIARRGHTAVVYDNSMYVFGGYVDMKGSSNELWRFRFDDGSWSLLASSGSVNDCPPARHSHSAVVYRNRMWIYGGLCNLQALDDLWTWHMDSRKWTRVQCLVRPPALEGHAACVAGNLMYVLGGCVNEKPQSDIWILHLDSLTWTRQRSGGIPCGPLSKHCCVVTSQARHSKSRSGVSRSTTAAPSRIEQRRATFPQGQSEMTASCHQTLATGSAMQVASDTRQNGHKNLDCDAVPTREVRVSSFKRNHRISYDELMECESVWIDSREDQLPSSATDFLKSAAPSCEKSTAVGSSAEIDNLLIDVKDGRSVRLEKSGTEHSMDTVSNPEPVLVEHDCLTSRPKVEQTNKQHVLSEDQEEPAGSWPEDVEGLDMEGKYFRSQFVDEAWASNEDLEESRPVDFDEVQHSSTRSKSTKKSYTIHVFGGQTTRAVPKAQILPMSVYRLAIANGK